MSTNVKWNSVGNVNKQANFLKSDHNYYPHLIIISSLAIMVALVCMTYEIEPMYTFEIIAF